MANTSPATVNITVLGINGQSVTQRFSGVTQIKYDFFENVINIVDTTGSFYFGYNTIATVTHVITGGVTTITIST
jgi:hypothetical protein